MGGRQRAVQDFLSVPRRNKHRGIKRSGVPSEFAVHFAGEIDSTDQVLPEGMTDAAEAYGLATESERCG